MVVKLQMVPDVLLEVDHVVVIGLLEVMVLEEELPVLLVVRVVLGEVVVLLGKPDELLPLSGHHRKTSSPMIYQDHGSLHLNRFVEPSIVQITPSEMNSVVIPNSMVLSVNMSQSSMEILRMAESANDHVVVMRGSSLSVLQMPIVVVAASLVPDPMSMPNSLVILDTSTSSSTSGPSPTPSTFSEAETMMPITALLIVPFSIAPPSITSGLSLSDFLEVGMPSMVPGAMCGETRVVATTSCMDPSSMGVSVDSFLIVVNSSILVPLVNDVMVPCSVIVLPGPMICPSAVVIVVEFDIELIPWVQFDLLPLEHGVSSHGLVTHIPVLHEVVSYLDLKMVDSHTKVKPVMVGVVVLLTGVSLDLVVFNEITVGDASTLGDLVPKLSVVSLSVSIDQLPDSLEHMEGMR